jgi:small-conductance mechanosensitive channel
LIAAAVAAKTRRMGADKLWTWFDANRDGLMIGLIVALVIVAVMLLLRELGRRTLRRDPEGWGWRSVIGRVLARTSLLFMILAAADVVSTYAELPHKIARLIDVLFVIAFALQGAVWTRELILGLIGHRVARDNGSSALGSAMAIIRVLVSVALFAIAGILILDNLGVNVTALVAGLGIGGIAIGLAAQGIFSDLFAALSILFDKPFKKGDTIRYDSSTGTVERIGLKTTRLRSITGEQLIMANTKLLERELHNMAQAKSRRVTLYLAVAGETSAAMIDAVTAAAEAAIESQKGCKLVRCALAGAGGGGLAFDMVYDDSTRDNDKLAADRAAILRALVETLQKHKLQLTRASEQAPAPLPF